MNGFRDWKFDICTDSGALNEWAGKSIDVFVLSRFLSGSDPARLLSQLRIIFPSVHVVLLVGQVTESCKAYMKTASREGLHNTVTGKLPGDRPYTLMVALTRSKEPELDGYVELGDIQDEPEVSELNEVDNNESGERFNDVQTDQDEPNYEYLEELPQSRPNASNRTGLLVISAANKGGIGKTTTSIYVATAIARAGIPTVIVDMDLGAPDVASFFGITDVPGIERLSSQGKINPAQIDRLLVKIDNLSILPGVMNKTLPRFESGRLASILEYLKSRFSVVVCDTSPEPWTKRWLYEVFEMADLALAVVDQSKFSEEETKNYGPTLLSMGLTPERIRIVVNRFSPQLHKLRVVEAAFNYELKKCKVLPRIGAVINEDRIRMEQATYRGVVTGLEDANSPWHKLAKEIVEMAGCRYEWIGGSRPPKNTGRGLFGLFGRKN
jgi:cellulose biosynthesis protein BcsQ